jgi:peptide chain release factor 3
MERVIVGVVGVLQFEVLEYRLKDEYGVSIYRTNIPHEIIRRVVPSPDLDMTRLTLGMDTRLVQDFRGNYLLIFPGTWAINWALDKNPGLELTEFDEMP